MVVKSLFLLLALTVLLAAVRPKSGEAAVIGLSRNCNKNWRNLPSANEVVSLMQSHKFTSIRLHEPDPDMLTALGNSSIDVIIGIHNEDLMHLAMSYETAKKWVQINILPFATSVRFKYIAAGSDAITHETGPIALFAMVNLQKALHAIGLNRTIKISTTVDANTVLHPSWRWPPSGAVFNAKAADYMTVISWFLSAHDAPLLANVYTYHSYVEDSMNMPLDFAMLKPEAGKKQDGNLTYTNLFDATVDSLYAAMDKIGAPSVKVVVTETGWPLAGPNGAANIANAETYTTNLIQHLKTGRGTPVRPEVDMEVHLFAMYTDDVEGSEEKFGLFYPNNKRIFQFPNV